MTRTLALALIAALVFAALSSPVAADVTVKVTLDEKHRGDVFIKIRSSLAQRAMLSALSDDRVRDTVLVRALVASPSELTELLSSRAFSGVAVKQTVDGSRVVTDVTATISDVRPLAALAGGSFEFSERPDNYLGLSGRFGGALAGQNADLSALQALPVTLRIAYSGTVREADNGAEVSHTAYETAWRVTGDRLLSEGVPVEVTVLPNIEGAPQYWLALILGVTLLVVVGAAIVLHRGREARV